MTCTNSRLTTSNFARAFPATIGAREEAQMKRFFGFALITFLFAILAQPVPLAAQGVIFVT